jgi:hypothetical protein
MRLYRPTSSTCKGDRKHVAKDSLRLRLRNPSHKPLKPGDLLCAHNKYFIAALAHLSNTFETYRLTWANTWALAKF